jgi:hypothetical protein
MKPSEIKSSTFFTSKTRFSEHRTSYNLAMVFDDRWLHTNNDYNDISDEEVDK